MKIIVELTRWGLVLHVPGKEPVILGERATLDVVNAGGDSSVHFWSNGSGGRVFITNEPSGSAATGGDS